jgi:hypothetical protein
MERFLEGRKVHGIPIEKEVESLRFQMMGQTKDEG